MNSNRDSFLADVIPMRSIRETFSARGYVHLSPQAAAQAGLDLAQILAEYDRLATRAHHALEAMQAGAAPSPLIVTPEAHAPDRICRFEGLADESMLIREQLVPLLARLAEHLAGEPLVLFKDKCNLKQPGGGAFPPHQDITAYRHFGASYHITAAVSLDPATAQNGALEMASSWGAIPSAVPRVQTPRGALPVLPSYIGGNHHGDIVDELTQHMQWELLESEPGSLILFDSYVPHCSKINRSKAMRRIMFFTFNLAREGELYTEYYRLKRASPDNPIFHVSTPTVHALSTPNNVNQPLRLNTFLTNHQAPSSKSISEYAHAHPDVLDLSIGEPHFGPPPQMLHESAALIASSQWLASGLKRYERLHGAMELRHAISAWYARRHHLEIDPEREILITHGGIEAINIALLTLTHPGDKVGVFDPTYALYGRAIQLLGRQQTAVRREHGENEIADALINHHVLDNNVALLINSPENPTGYVANETDWQALATACERANCWLIHDEVYDTLSTLRRHRPARAIRALASRSVLVNSCSKKFGVPGLRIGWMVADAAVIDAAARVHEVLCLSVNPVAEALACELLRHTPESWLNAQAQMIAERHQRALTLLNAQGGYAWPRLPLGGLFLFPDVRKLYESLPTQWTNTDEDIGSTVARYLLETAKVAVVPGAIYGKAGVNHIRITTGSDASVYDTALQRLSCVH